MNAEDDQLAERAAELTEEVGKLRKEVSRGEADQKRMRRWIRLTGFGLLLDLSLTIFGVTLFAKVDHNTHAVQQVQRITSTQALCPLYGVFLDSYAPQKQKPEDLARYEHSFAVIRAGNSALGCPNR